MFKTGDRVDHLHNGEGTVQVRNGWTIESFTRVKFDRNGLTLRVPTDSLERLSNVDASMESGLPFEQ